MQIYIRFTKRNPMNVFYVPNIHLSAVFQLDENESGHCIRVLRLRIGDEIMVIDGIGGLHKAKIADANPKKALIQVVSSEFQAKPSPHITIAIAPTKQIERFEWFLEKAVEIGVSRIIPLLCEKSERKVITIERLDKIIVSAMKQSLHLHKPEILPLIKFVDAIKNDSSSQHFIAHCEELPKQSLKMVCKPGIDTSLYIGPEGDFCSKEIAAALYQGFVPVSLGESRLRTETAGVVACHSFQFINQ